MKQKRMKIIKLLVLPLVLFLFSCEKDLYDEHIKGNSIENQITLAQFKKETGLSNFSPSINVKRNSSNLQRNADLTY